jgi:hypothetical protein
MKFLGVSGVFDYAGLSRNSRSRSRPCCLPRITKTSASGLHLFEARSPTPPIPCLRFAGSLTVAAQDSGPGGSLLPSCKTLSFSASCRFIPAHCYGDLDEAAHAADARWSLSAVGSGGGANQCRVGGSPAGVQRISWRTITSVIMVRKGISQRFGAEGGAGWPRKIPCKTEANAKSCYWTHGRLMLHEGTPSFRLWKIGTHRMLAIWSGPSVDYEGGAADNEHSEFPANIRRVFRPSKNGIFADFDVCPLESETPNVMQAACIESAKNIFIEDFDK